MKVFIRVLTVITLFLFFVAIVMGCNGEKKEKEMEARIEELEGRLEKCCRERSKMREWDWSELVNCEWDRDSLRKVIEVGGVNVGSEYPYQE